MKLSTKGRYGLRMMVDLAIYSRDNCVSLKDISTRQNISENYLEKLMSVLKKEGYVNSIRGAQGGYTLAIDPKSITVGDILRTLEGDLTPVECVLDCNVEDSMSKCTNSDCCVTKTVWEKINESVNNVVDSITLQDLIDGKEI